MVEQLLEELFYLAWLLLDKPPRLMHAVESTVGPGRFKLFRALNFKNCSANDVTGGFHSSVHLAQYCEVLVYYYTGSIL